MFQHHPLHRQLTDDRHDLVRRQRERTRLRRHVPRERPVRPRTP